LPGQYRDQSQQHRLLFEQLAQTAASEIGNEFAVSGCARRLNEFVDAARLGVG